MTRSVILAAIEQNHSDFAAKVTKLRISGLSHEERVRRITSEYEAAVTRHRVLVAQLRALESQEMIDLLQTAFAPVIPVTASAADKATITAAHRDALAKAAAAPDRQALMAMHNQAVIVGDVSLRRAVAFEARQRGDWHLLRDLAQNDDSLQRIFDAESPRSARDRIVASAETTPPFKPDEVKGPMFF